MSKQIHSEANRFGSSHSEADSEANRYEGEAAIRKLIRKQIFQSCQEARLKDPNTSAIQIDITTYSWGEKDSSGISPHSKKNILRRSNVNRSHPIPLAHRRSRARRL